MLWTCPCGEKVPVHPHWNRRWCRRRRLVFDNQSWADVWAHLWTHDEQAGR